MRLIDADAMIKDTLKDPIGRQLAERYNLIGYIEGRPTIEERKTGKWIDETFKPWGLVYHPYKCDQCGECSEADSDFCPNCGARMENYEKAK